MSLAAVKEPPIQGNPNYPLHPDYWELSAEGQRLDRVNASRLWTMPGKGLERARRRVASLNFFDRYYLWPDQDNDFDPGFYEFPPLNTPEIHWALSRLWAAHRMSLTIMPRGSAKSTHCRKDSLLGLVTVPGYSIVYATSTHDNSKFTGNVLRNSCYYNQRINDDWCREYRVDSLKPPRGDKPTGVEHFYLGNRSHSRQVSMESRVRGVRPRRFKLDDPEYDGKASTNSEERRENMQQFLFSVCLPTVTHAGSGIDWTATYVSSRHYAYHAMQVTDTPDGPKAADPRFNYWARFFIPAAIEEKDPKTGVISLRSCWPEMWPVTKKERLEKDMDESMSLEEMREMMGAAAFNKEMLGKPGVGEDQFFTLDVSPKGQHAYWYEDVDNLLDTHPRRSETKICWLDKDGNTESYALKDFLAHTRLFMTVDTAYTEHAHSDRRVATVMGLTRDNYLFCLDMWSDRKKDSVLLEKAMAMCEKWQCRTICVEVVKESLHTYNRFKNAVATRTQHDMGFNFNPRVKDIRPGMMPKEAKISTLDTRFEHNLIKLPLWKRGRDASWVRLFSQIEDFNPGVANGGLQHDDELDTVSMSGLVIKGRPSDWVKKEEALNANAIDPFQEIMDGRDTLPNGYNLIGGLDPTMLSPEQVAALMSRAASKKGPAVNRA